MFISRLLDVSIDWLNILLEQVSLYFYITLASLLSRLNIWKVMMTLTAFLNQG